MGHLASRTLSLRRATLLATLAAAFLMPSTTLAASGDLAFSRMSQYTGLDSWAGVSSYGMSVVTAGKHGRHALVRRHNRSGNVVWSRALPTPSKAYAGILGVATDSSGIYVAGWVSPYDEDLYEEDSRAFVARYLYNGTLDWYQTLDVKGSVVATGITTYGSFVYVVGQMQESEALGGPDAGFVQKLTRDGAYVWTELQHFRAPGPTFIQLPVGVAVSADGVFVTGQAWLDADHEQVVEVRKYGLAGTEQWTDLRAIAGISRGVAIAADSSGVYVVARAWDYGTGGTTPPNGGFLIKYSSGGYAWRRRVTEASSSLPSGVALAPSGVWIAGTTRARLLNQPPGTVADPDGDAYSVRYSRSGTPLSQTQYADPDRQTVAGMDADASGVYVAGEASAFDPQTAMGAQDGLMLGIEVP